MHLSTNSQILKSHYYLNRRMLTANFDIENQKTENKNKTIGFTIAVLIHAILLAILFYVVITTPDPPFQENEGGMTVNFGTSDVGSGDVQPMNLTPVASNEPITPTTSNSTPEATQETHDVATQDLEEAPVIEKKTEVKKPKVKPNPDAVFKPNTTPTKPNTTPTPVKPKANDDALFKPGAKGPPNNSTGDGEGKGKGDQGDPNGDANSKNYHGGGDGNGIGKGSGLGDGNVKLVGRKIKFKPKFKNPCSESRGKVVIVIKVNKEGKVVAANFTQAGSSTTDDCLVNLSKQNAAQYLFDVKEDAPEVQTGSILFRYGED